MNSLCVLYPIKNVCMQPYGNPKQQYKNKTTFFLAKPGSIHPYIFAVCIHVYVKYMYTCIHACLHENILTCKHIHMKLSLDLPLIFLGYVNVRILKTFECLTLRRAYSNDCGCQYCNKKILHLESLDLLLLLSISTTSLDLYCP